AYGAMLERTGNRSCDAAPQGLYRCGGEERWLALSVETDQQWESAKVVLGHPPWAELPELATSQGRHAGHDRLDAELALWSSDQDLDSVVERFIAAGVPAGAVRDPRLSD